MPSLRVVGESKLNKDAPCPFCKEIGKPKGTVIEIIQDLESGRQYASFTCNNCHEPVMLV